MEQAQRIVNARTIREAQDSVEAQMARKGKRIREIMAVTGKSYQRVREVLELAGLS